MHYDPERHHLIGERSSANDIGRSFSRTFHRDFFVYFHRMTEAFVLAMWMKKGVSFKEFHVFGERPRFESQDEHDSLHRRVRNALSPEEIAKFTAAIARDERNALLRQKERADERRDKYKWLSKRVKSMKVPMPVDYD